MVPRILIIDDRNNLPRFIALELNAKGYQVSIRAKYSVESWMIQVFRPDLIILNWELRCQSGSDVYHHLKVTHPQIPIIIITAKDENSDRVGLISEKQTCLTKPFSMSDLLIAIEYEFISRKQLTTCRRANLGKRESISLSYYLNPSQ
ncbi:response regulator [Leptolyngbya sp. AN02str]|uniref:response regulator n=1 Tax=Leptolyngbya sp. AN02str TaxID=3423363 RepID=UPI003D31C9F4